MNVNQEGGGDVLQTAKSVSLHKADDAQRANSAPAKDDGVKSKAWLCPLRRRLPSIFPRHQSISASIVSNRVHVMSASFLFFFPFIFS